jgi:hypothetical protein
MRSSGATYRSFLILLSFAPRRLAPSCLGLPIFCGNSMRLRLVMFRMMLLSASSAAAGHDEIKKRVIYGAGPCAGCGWVIPYQGIIEPNSTMVLAVLQKASLKNNEQETSAHQRATDLHRRRRSVGARSNGQSHRVGWVQGKRVPFGGGLLRVATIAEHRLFDPRCTHALDGGLRTTAPAGCQELPNSNHFHHCI